MRPRRLSELGRLVTEGANDSNPIRGFQGEEQSTSPRLFCEPGVGQAREAEGKEGTSPLVPVRALRCKNPKRNSSKQNLPAY